jgi:VWFA-related protein
VTRAADLAQTKGQIYLFVLDDYHILPDETPRARDIVAGFIRTRLTDDDEAAVVIVSGGGQDFTNDREALLAAVERIRGRMLSVAPSEPKAHLPTLAETPAEAQIHARATLKAIQDASGWLADARGRRKILFLVSDDVGCVWGPDRVSPCGFSLSDALKSAQRADVSIYPLYTHGLDVPDCLKAQFAGGLPSNCGPASVSARARGPRSALSVLATETGGFMINDTNNFDGAFDRVLRENALYYLVGYYSTNVSHDGKFRKNELRLTRKDLRVQYRTGYTAPRIQ